MRFGRSSILLTIDHVQIKIQGQNVDWPIVRNNFRTNVSAIQTRHLSRIFSRVLISFRDNKYQIFHQCLHRYMGILSLGGRGRVGDLLAWKNLCNAWMHECWNQDANTPKLHEKQKHSQFPDVMKLQLFLKIVSSKLTDTMPFINNLNLVKYKTY